MCRLGLRYSPLYANGGLLLLCAGWMDCNGGPDQIWRLGDDGLFVNEAASMCLSMQQFCVISTAWLSLNVTASAL